MGQRGLLNAQWDDGLFRTLGVPSTLMHVYIRTDNRNRTAVGKDTWMPFNIHVCEILVRETNFILLFLLDLLHSNMLRPESIGKVTKTCTDKLSGFAFSFSGVSP